MKVLIIKLSSIGDVVHALPALQALRKGFEKGGVKAEIDWLVEEAASGIVEGNPLIDNVIVARRGWAGNLGHNLKTARLIRSRGYDMVLDFQGLLKSGAWVMLSGGKRRIGFSNSREMSHLFLNEKLPPYDPDRHAVERYMDLARYAGGLADEAVFPLHVTKGAERKAAEELRRCGLQNTPFFILVTRARWKTKLWSDDKFRELARRIMERTGLKAVLAGSEADRPAIEAMRAGIGAGAYNLAGLTGLKELAALFRLSRFAVTVDSGPMHIAAAAGTRVVALFGPTAPWRTGPYGEGHVIVRKGLECSPCFSKSCRDQGCMNGITVDEVMEAVERVMEGKRS